MSTIHLDIKINTPKDAALDLIIGVLQDSLEKEGYRFSIKTENNIFGNED